MAYHNERECSVDDLVPHLKEAVKRLLPNNEQVLICCETVHEPSNDERIRNRFSNFFKEDWRTHDLFEIYFAYVITSKRLIRINHVHKDPQKGMWENKAWSLVDIRNIREEFRDTGYMFWLDINIGTVPSQGIPISFGSKPLCDKFIAILKQAVNQSKNISPINQPEPFRSPEERLRALMQLRNEGLINDLEFEQKRREILGQL